MEMLVLALISLILHSSTGLQVSQCFHCVITDNVQKTRFYCDTTRFSAFNVVFAEKRVYSKEMLVLALVSLILHVSTRLLVSKCFHCVKTDNVHETPF